MQLSGAPLLTLPVITRLLVGLGDRGQHGGGFRGGSGRLRLELFDAALRLLQPRVPLVELAAERGRLHVVTLELGVTLA